MSWMSMFENTDQLIPLEKELVDILRDPSGPRILPEKAIEELPRLSRVSTAPLRGLLFRIDPNSESGDDVFLAALFLNDPDRRFGPWLWKSNREELVWFARQVLEHLDGS